MQAAQQAIPKNKTNKEQQFVHYIIDRCNQDKGFIAKLRRADNPATEYQSWEILGPWIDLENSYERLPYATIAAAIARSKADKNGSLPLGKAIAMCYPEAGGADKYSDQTKARLRRLLACHDVAEACRILRSTLTLIDSKLGQPIDFSALLRQLRFFGESSKIRWAKDFYNQRDQDKTTEVQE
ncbi:type I-E CRISPR-associated protein Cse2/CasB [Marinospirillum insulare]|uniref:Type I-E CRISPR-associated protein Cse2/CasB n=1 Tax=Marinospirillum insulare TaxID=217169 RepID=A0ABQ5ZXC8_9GAMM|nr:type I-E CRISPR-associated protein Cse2/CasB [Marinospirillum insulare]GLR62600.1 type I-E CRISPR-associated protein Cse2/CasB [Marinospirillum insulare]